MGKETHSFKTVREGITTHINKVSEECDCNTCDAYIEGLIYAYKLIEAEA